MVEESNLTEILGGNTKEINPNQGILELNGKKNFYLGFTRKDKQFILTSNRQLLNAEYDKEKKNWKITTPNGTFYLSKAMLEVKNQLSNDAVKRFHAGEAVNGEELFERISKFISGYVEFDSKSETSLVSVHVLHTYLLYVFGCTPYLFLIGKPNTGKTTAQKVWAALAFKGVYQGTPTAAVLYRTIDKSMASIAVDEFDKLSEAERHPIIAVYNMGYTRDGSVARSKPRTFEPEFFDAFSAKICAANDLSYIDSFRSRCIEITTMPTTRHLKNWDARLEEERMETQRLVDDCWLFALQHWQDVEKYFRDITNQHDVSNRRNQIIAPLLAIARTISAKLESKILIYYEESADLLEESIRDNDWDVYLVRLVDELLGGALSVNIPLSNLASDLTSTLHVEGLLDEKRTITTHKVGKMLDKLKIGREKTRNDNRRSRWFYMNELLECKRRFKHLFNTAVRVTSVSSATSSTSNEQGQIPVDITYHNYSLSKVSDQSGNSDSSGQKE